MVGAGGHGRVVCEAIVAAGASQVVGFVDDGIPAGTEFCGFSILGQVSQLATWVDSHLVTECVVAAGDNAVRRALVERISALVPTLRFATVVHPGALVSASAQIEPGAVILAGAVVSTGARVGAHCIINTGGQLDHDSVLDDYASLAPGAVTGGCVRVGSGTAIGLGASVIHGIAIGAETVVGAGAVVVRPVPENVVVLGVPAKVVATRQRGDTYL